MWLNNSLHWEDQSDPKMCSCRMALLQSSSVRRGSQPFNVIQQKEKRQSTSDSVGILSNIKCRRYFAFISVEVLSYGHANHHATK